MDQPIYLDHNATTPVLPEVADTMRAAMAEPYLNPASQHEFGRRARRVLEDARERIGELLGAKVGTRDADQVVFTSGGTEANNLAIRGLLPHTSGEGRSESALHGRIVTSALEHPSVAALVDEFSKSGWQIDRLGIDSTGVVRVDELQKLLQPQTKLVCLMLAHNETGVLQPVAAAAVSSRPLGVPLHCDAAQAAGKVPIHFHDLGATTMTVAAHKFHGPLGIGALVVRHGTRLAPQWFGGFQQAGLRPGTESVVLAIGMRRALELWHDEQDERAQRMIEIRNRFETAIASGRPSAIVIGVDANRLPHTSNIAFVGLDRQALFIALDQAGVACSTGSACASGSSEPSPAHIGMGLSEAVYSSALRFSFGATTTAAEVEEATRRILKICNDLRRQKER